MILVAGSLNYDIILKVKRMPREGERASPPQQQQAAKVRIKLYRPQSSESLRS